MARKYYSWKWRNGKQVKIEITQERAEEISKWADEQWGNM